MHRRHRSAARTASCTVRHRHRPRAARPPSLATIGRRAPSPHLAVVLSVALLGSILSTILAALDRRVLELRRQELLRRTLDAELITKLDSDGDGIDRAEFVLGMLEMLEVRCRPAPPPHPFQMPSLG